MTRILFVLAVAACGSSSTTPSQPAPPPPPAEGGGEGSAPASGECITTGCSGTICAKPGNDMMTTCEMKPEYQCYQGAECKVQETGECGWTMDDKLTACLASPPPLQ